MNGFALTTNLDITENCTYPLLLRSLADRAYYYYHYYCYYCYFEISADNCSVLSISCLPDTPTAQLLRTYARSCLEKSKRSLIGSKFTLGLIGQFPFLCLFACFWLSMECRLDMIRNMSIQRSHTASEYC